MRILILLLLSCLQAQAIELKVARGRFSLIDFGSLIISKPVVLNQKLVNIYTLSGLDNEEAQSIIAIQGLEDQGRTDLTVDTQAGIYQFHLVLDEKSNQDLILGQARRSIIQEGAITLNQSRSCIVSSPSHINRYILAADPNLISYQNIKDYYHPDFLKVFSLASNKQEGITDIVLPTKTGVYKFTVLIKGAEDENHTNLIDLNSITSSSG
jgi:hypothetical protein